MTKENIWIIALVTFVLKWIPGLQFLLLKDWNVKSTPGILTRFLCHPFMLSFYQMKNIWSENKETIRKRKQCQILRGCVDAPILFIIQFWMVTYGLIELKWSDIYLRDWEGNCLKIPYLTVISLVFGFTSILRSSVLLQGDAK